MAKARKRPASSSPPIPSGPELVPVEVRGLDKVLALKRLTVRELPENLGEFLQPWFEKNIQKPGDKLGALTELWMQLVPQPLLAHTRLMGFHRGSLMVCADSAPVRHQLDTLLRQGLLAQLQSQSKGTIFRVKTMVDGSTAKEIS